MSRITGSDALKMFEAYAEVYAPQEITEEQIWEEVENWVNSLLEEGYDLSEYTWEEMYEEYLKEYGENAGLGYARSPKEIERTKLMRQQQQAAQASGARQALQQGRTLGVAGNFGLQTGTRVKMDSAATRQQGRTVLNTINRGPGAADPTITLGGRKFDRLTKGSNVQYIERKPQKPAAQDPGAGAGAGSGGGGGGGSGAGRGGTGSGSTVTPTAAKTEPTRPAAPAKPATGMLGKTSFERRTPTSAELKAAQAARAGGANPEQALRAAKAAGTASKIQSAGQTAGAKAFSSPTAGASAFKPATIAAAPSTSPSASGSLAPATASIASKPSAAMTQDSIRKQRLNMEMEYDAYDIVLEYLLSNGHVETVDEALYVMLEMEAEVIQDIVEEQKATWDKGQKLSDPRAQKIYDKMTGPKPVKLPPA